MNAARTEQESTVPPAPIIVKIDLRWLVLSGETEFLLSQSLRKTICSALREKGIMVRKKSGAANNFATDQEDGTLTANRQQMLGIFRVTNLLDGLVTTRSELKNLDLLEYSEIGWMDFPEGKLRYGYPTKHAAPISEIWDFFKK
jgi:hypothetical protein